LERRRRAVQHEPERPIRIVALRVHRHRRPLLPRPSRELLELALAALEATKAVLGVEPEADERAVAVVEQVGDLARETGASLAAAPMLMLLLFAAVVLVLVLVAVLMLMRPAVAELVFPVAVRVGTDLVR